MSSGRGILVPVIILSGCSKAACLDLVCNLHVAIRHKSVVETDICASHTWLQTILLANTDREDLWCKMSAHSRVALPRQFAFWQLCCC